jgi:hypothetical protein
MKSLIDYIRARQRRKVEQQRLEDWKQGLYVLKSKENGLFLFAIGYIHGKRTPIWACDPDSEILLFSNLDEARMLAEEFNCSVKKAY